MGCENGMLFYDDAHSEALSSCGRFENLKDIKTLQKISFGHLLQENRWLSEGQR